MLKKSLKIFILCTTVFVILFFVNGLSSAQINILGSEATSKDSFAVSWSADSYVPPDYEGKALPIPGSSIRVVAVPAKMLSLHPDKHIYRWLLDGNIIGQASGQGRATFRFQTNKWQNAIYKVGVQILDASETLVFKKVITIEVTRPKLLFHHENSLYSLQNTFWAFTGQNIKLTAVPLFFNIKSLNDLDWQWKIDNEPVSLDEQKDQSYLAIKIPAAELNGETIEKDISVSAVNNQDDTQSTSANLIMKIR